MIKEIDLICPKCNHHFKANVYPSINVQMDEGIKNKILTGKLFDFECCHCHSHFEVSYPCLYHDMDLKLMIQFVIDDKEDIKQEIPKDYVFRVVDSYRSWIEKILIFDSNLDDRYMELYKLLVLSQYEQRENLNGLYYWNVNGTYALALDEKETSTFHYMPFNKDVYDQVVQVFKDEIDQPVIVDSAWAISQTKG